MKTCQEYEEFISAYLDGELSGDGQLELMEHMASCLVCQRYFDDLVEIHAAMAPEEAAVPEGFSARVMEQVRASVQERPQPEKVVRVPQWKRWTALAACFAAAVLGVFSFQRLGNAPPDGQASVAAYEAADEGAPAAYNGGDGIAPQCQDAPVFRSAQGAAYDEEPEAAPAEEEAVFKKDSAPVPAPAAAGKENASGPPAGTITAGGETVRQWVEEELGLAWEPGELYPLGAEEYARVLALLTEAGAPFTQEAGEGYWLLAE